jgi:hypothetical protein
MVFATVNPVSYLGFLIVMASHESIFVIAVANS